MDIWKYPEDVTNERCKVKCPVKSSGDLKQAAFTASGRLPQTIILGTPSPQLGVTTGQRSRSARLQMLLVSQRQGWRSRPLGHCEDMGPPAWRISTERCLWSALACLLQAGAQFQWLNVGRQSAGSPSKPLWIKLMQPGVPLQLGLRWHLLLPFN